MRAKNHGVSYQMAGLQLMKEHRNASKRGRAAQLKSEAAVETEKTKLEYAIAARGNVIEQLEQFASSAAVNKYYLRAVEFAPFFRMLRSPSRLRPGTF